MLSKNKIKELTQLHVKKFRDEQAVFIAEGPKLVNDLLPYFECVCLVGTNDWLSKNKPKVNELIEADELELKKISLLKTPQQVFAVFKRPVTSYDVDTISEQLCLALDDIQDPGNLGTIIRIADWFGIKHIFCSLHCADAFNPKTIQASMGAIARVQVHAVDLVHFLQQVSSKTTVYGTFLEGENIYTEPLGKNGIVIMGNEGNGISSAVKACLHKKLFIPNYPIDKMSSESLNVSMATAIVCSEFRRRVL